MLMAGIGLAAAAWVLWRSWDVRERPLDDSELQFIRHFDDQSRKELIHPFE
jgi:hypothetical protein